MTEPAYTFEGFLQGSRLQPVTIAELCHAAGWRDLYLVMAVAVCLAESAGYTRAHNRKTRAATGELVSMDIGLFQIKVDAGQVGGAFAESLWLPATNVAYAKRMFNGRGWQPWYAWVDGIAQDPSRAGKYLQRAAWAVMNLYLARNGASQIPSPWGRLGTWRLDRWIKRGALVTRRP